MKIVKPEIMILDELDGEDIIKKIEQCGRTCYKSENLSGEDTSMRFVKNLIMRGHESVLEHANISIKIICDRGVSHELVRHRIASYSQESTRYCNYSKDAFGGEISVIEHKYFKPGTRAYELWRHSCEDSEKAYFELLGEGCSPQEARSVLPNSLKTEVVATMNLRAWRNFFKQRIREAAHPDMRDIARYLLWTLCQQVPVVFDDVEESLV